MRQAPKIRDLLLAIVATIAAPAYAQFGIGLSPGMSCPYPYRASNQAMNGNDELSNLRRRIIVTREKIKGLKAELKKVDGDIAKAKDRMGRVLSDGAVAAIEEHYEHRRDRASYRAKCGERAAADGDAGAGPKLTHGTKTRTGAKDENHPSPPSSFCLEDGYNDWDNVVQDDGFVDEAVCDYYVPAKSKRPAEERVSACRDGLDAYYDLMKAKNRGKDKLKSLEDLLDEDGDQLDDVRESVTEGTYCAWCAGRRRQTIDDDNEFGSGNWLQMGAMAIALLSRLNNRGQQQQQPYPIYPGRRPGYAPPFMAPGIPNPGGPAFLGNPYPARVSGLPFVRNGQYGALPGSIGPGAFACQGTSPFGLNNPLAANFSPFDNLRSDPFNNPFRDPFGDELNTFNQNPLLNSGFGPGFMPILGNGLRETDPFGNDPFGQDPFGTDPFGQGNLWGNNQWGANGAPAVLPMNGLGLNGLNGANSFNGSANPFWSAPYTYNPLAPYGNSFWNGQGGAPSVLPYPTGSIVNPNWNLGFGSAPFVGSTVQNFAWQMEQLRRNVTTMQNGSAYGLPPAVLPMPTSGQPGVLPVNGTGVPAVLPGN